MNARSALVGSAALSLAPSAVAWATGLGVPPDRRDLFVVVALAVPGLTVGAILAGRTRVRALAPDAARRLAIAVALGAGILLTAYAALFNLCVVNGFADAEPVYFPLWTTGQAAEMISRAGGRFAALERYGPAALVDALARMPPMIALLTSAILATLYAAISTSAPALVAMWAVRDSRPTAVRPPRTAGAEPELIVDVFLCHNSKDKPAVRSAAAALELRGLRTWLDNEELHPGDPWPEVLEIQLRSARSAAVFIGPTGIGDWQRLEINALLEESVRRGCKIVPVLLPSATDASIPVLLRQFNWVDLRKGTAELENLARAIGPERL